MAKIFISYKRVDKDKVFKIKDQLESALGEKCWIDLDGIESDAQFANVIIKAINECEVFLFMYSSTHIQITDYKNDWTVRELDFAQHKKKRIVFINLDASPLSDWFYMLFGTMQQVDATNPDSMARLIQDIIGWLGKTIQIQDIHSKHIGESFIKRLFDAAKRGDPNAQNDLGISYIYGQGVSKNEKEAVIWFIKAAEQNHSEAQRNLGICYEYGIGVEKDEITAIEWYKKAANQGSAEAMFRLALCYQNAIGVVQNTFIAIDWYEKAAENGSVKAQYNLGLYYQEGQFVKKDLSKAFKLFNQAASQEFAPAQYAVGQCFEYGKGVPLDGQKAIEWYEKAAKQGYAEAQYNLGVCYFNATGTVRNVDLAKYWIGLAAKQGLSAAIIALPKIVEK